MTNSHSNNTYKPRQAPPEGTGGNHGKEGREPGRARLPTRRKVQNPDTARDAEAAAPGDGAHTGECRVGRGKPPVHSRFRPLRGAAAIGFVSQFRPRPSDPTS